MSAIVEVEEIGWLTNAIRSDEKTSSLLGEGHTETTRKSPSCSISGGYELYKREYKQKTYQTSGGVSL